MLLQVMNILTFCDKKLWTRRQWKKQNKRKRKDGKTSGCNNTKCATIEIVESKENVDDHVEFELKYYPNELCCHIRNKDNKINYKPS